MRDDSSDPLELPDLPELSSGSSSVEDEYDKILKTAEEEKRKDKDSALKEEQRKKSESSKKTLIIAGAGVTAIAALTGVLVFANPFSQSDSNSSSKDSKTKTSQQADPKTNISKNAKPPTKLKEGEVFWANDEGIIYPIKLEKWQEAPYAIEGVNREQLNKKYRNKNMNMDRIARKFPSEAAGSTSNPNKKTNPDGTSNPNYTLLTDADVEYTVDKYLELIVNPQFGDWTNVQYAKNHPNKSLDINTWSKVFTTKYFYDNYNKKPYKDWMPLYADWNENDYGMKDQLLEEGPRWIGEVKSAKMKDVSDSHSDDPSKNATKFTVDAVVKYTAWLNDGDSISKDGTLKLTLVPNENIKDTEHKLLIDSSSLEVSRS